MKNTRGQNGITLVALVVTIIILLILAGVTITYVLSDGGIFSAAGKADEKTAYSSVKEYAEYMQSEAMVKWYSEKADLDIKDNTPEGKTADEKIQDYFPTSYKVSSAAITKVEKGKIDGTFTVTVNSTDYSVTFKSGVCSITPNPFEGE